MENLKEAIGEQLPKNPRILGFYNEEEEHWVKAPKEEILAMIGLTIEEITQFVIDTIRQVKRLSEALDVEKVSFELEVQGNKIRFTVMLKKKA